jgi:hypothetical protein
MWSEDGAHFNREMSNSVGADPNQVRKLNRQNIATYVASSGVRLRFLYRPTQLVGFLLNKEAV